MNSTAAAEWLIKVWHNYSAAYVLFERVCLALKLDANTIRNEL